MSTLGLPKALIYVLFILVLSCQGKSSRNSRTEFIYCNQSGSVEDCVDTTKPVVSEDLQLSGPTSASVGEEVTLEWTEINADTYDFILASDQQGENPVVKFVGLPSAIRYQTVSFSQAGDFYVCLRALDIFGRSVAPANDGWKVSVSEGTGKKKSTSKSPADFIPSITVALSDSTFGPASTSGVQTSFSGVSAASAGVSSVQVSVKNETSGFCLNSSKTAFDQGCPSFLNATGTTNWSLDLDDSLFVDGVQYTFRVVANSSDGQKSNPSNKTVTWDAGIPTTSFVINTGDPSLTNSTSVTLVHTSSPDTKFYRTSNSSDCSAASWIAYSAGNISHILSTGDGLKTVCLQVKDGAGNESATATDDITLDATLPSSTVNSSGKFGPPSTAGSTTEFDGVASDSEGINAVYVSISRSSTSLCLNSAKTNFVSTCPNWIPVSGGTTSWTISVDDSLFVGGENYVIFADAEDVSNSRQLFYDSKTITWDSTPPSSDFAINSGDPARTNSTSVDLVLTDENDIAHYRAANGTDCSAASWNSYSGGNIAHTLSAGSGAKSVCLETRDSVGNIGVVATDSITLDVNLPTSVITTTGVFGPASTGGSTTDFVGTASDNDTVSKVEISFKNNTTSQCLNGSDSAFDQACPNWISVTSGTTSWTATVNDSVFSDGTSYELSARATDIASNIQSPVTTSTLTYDSTLPTSAVSTTGNLGPNSTIGANTSIVGTASDTNGIGSVSISLKSQTDDLCLNTAKTLFNAACPSWLAATGTTLWSLSVTDSLFLNGQSYDVESRATDAVGNV